MEKKLEDCIEGCRNGDPKAQSELYLRYASWLKRRVLPLVGDEALAEDLAHDAFILILAHIRELKDNSRLEPWMSLVLRRVALQYLRGWYARHILLPGELPEPRSCPSDREAPLTREELERLAMRLPKGCRKVFRLAYFDGLTHLEIARILGIHPHSSSSQLARARVLFRKILKDYGVGLPFLALWIWAVQEADRHTPADQLPETAFGSSPSLGVSTSSSPRRSPLARMRPHKNAAAHSHADTLATGTLAADTLQSPTVTKAPPVFTLSLPSVVQKQNPAKVRWPSVSNRRKHWTLSLAYRQNRSLSRTAPKAMPILTRTIGSGGSPCWVPGQTTSWDTYYEYLTTFFPSFENPEQVLNLIDIARQNKGQQIRETACYDPPAVVKMQVGLSWEDRWQADMGLQYKRLGAQFRLGSDTLMVTRQSIQYMGLSAGATWNAWQFRRFSIQLSAGVSLDIPVTSSSRTEYVFEGRAFYSEQNAVYPRPQWSLFGGIGMDIPLKGNISIFFAPQLEYYLPSGGSVRTIHTDRPLEFSVPVGIRWNY